MMVCVMELDNLWWLGFRLEPVSDIHSVLKIVALITVCANTGVRAYVGHNSCMQWAVPHTKKLLLKLKLVKSNTK